MAAFSTILRLSRNSTRCYVPTQDHFDVSEKTLYEKLYQANIPDASELFYVMEKRGIMSLVAARLRLERVFPIIGVPPS